MLHNPLLQIASNALSPFIWYKTRIPKVQNNNVTIEIINDVRTLENVYNKWEKPDRIYTIRDETYLNWRFKFHPEIAYQYLAAYAGQEVISMTESMGMKKGTIVDYLMIDDEPNVFEPLLNYSLNIFKDNKCALADTWVFTQKWAQQIVEDYGFLSFPKHPSNMILVR